MDIRVALDLGWVPPERLGHYRIVRLLGRGAMGSVYLADDTHLDRRVAIKFVASPTPDENAKRQLRAEARAAAQIKHPNVVSIYHIGETDGVLYLVTELVLGETLRSIPKPLSQARLLEIARGMTRALAAAHRKGILHRDIKPENAMLDEDGEVKVVDFGLAKMIDAQAMAASLRPDAAAADPAAQPFSLTGGIVGTPKYMAPECLAGASATVESDIYSLGSVLYELASGNAPRPPFNGQCDPDAWLRMRPAPLAHDGHDPRFVALVERCLSFEPEARFGSADEILEELALIAQPRPKIELAGGNPYRGLAPFDAEHRGVFFGRTSEIRIVLERMVGESFVLVTGDSGIGKSSLCRAGVLPEIRAGALGAGWTVASMLPGREPLRSLAHAFAKAAEIEGEPLFAAVREDAAALAQAAASRWPKGQGGLVIFVDQLEELCTVSDRAEAIAFAEAIAELCGATSVVRVLATARGDFFTRLAAVPRFGDLLPNALFLLGALSEEAIRLTIVAPARMSGVVFEPPSLVDELVGASVAAPGGLALLQFALVELWERRDRVHARIEKTALDALGGVRGALARHADTTLERLNAEERPAARRLLLRLVSVRSTNARKTAAELGLDDGPTKRAIEALIRGRLIVAREIDGVTAYEVAHEALLEAWSTLQRWLEADGDRRRVRTRIEVAAHEWDRLGRVRDALWGQRQLADAARIDEADLDARAREFLEASRRRVRVDRLRRWALALALPTVGLALYGGVRMKAARDLHLQIAERVAGAESWIAQGSGRKEEGRKLRAEAFLGFDSMRVGSEAESKRKRDEAELVWQRALDALRAAESAYGRAQQTLGSALALDPGAAGVRSMIGEVLRQRIELAEWLHDPDRRNDLAPLLDVYGGEDGHRWLVAPPSLSITTSPPGARAVIARYVDDHGRLALGDMRTIGQTPVALQALDQGPGSYLLILSLEGREQVRYPILLGRAERMDIALDLPAADAIPDGFVYIPPGRFLVGSGEPEWLRRGFLNTTPIREARTDGFAIAKKETTFGEWLAFLRALSKSERPRRLPLAQSRQWGVAVSEKSDGKFELTLTLEGEVRRALEGQPIRYPVRDRRVAQDWREFPVSGVSLHDAEAYTAWLASSGRIPGARICDEWEWERAARGADDRIFPHGARFAPDDANIDETYGRKTGAFGPDVVGAHPASVSPFGLFDMAGNVYELTKASPDREEVLIRGGYWYLDQASAWIHNRTNAQADTRDLSIGFRVCASVGE